MTSLQIQQLDQLTYTQGIKLYKRVAGEEYVLNAHDSLYCKNPHLLAKCIHHSYTKQLNKFMKRITNASNH